MNTAQFFLIHRIKNRQRQNRIDNRQRRGTPTKFKRLELSEWTNRKCASKTRFTQAEITRICDIIGFDSHLMFNSLRVSRELALAILLNRLSFPQKNKDMGEDIFGMSEDNIGRVVNGIAKLLIAKFKTGLEFDERQISKENCERFSKAIFDRGAFLSHVVGFIDETIQQICRPKDNEVQNLFYNEWKHIHCVKFKTISTPDGITSSVFEPYNASNNDQGMVNSSGTLSRLISHCEKVSPDKDFVVYGDEAYSIGKHIVSAFPKENMNGVQDRCNKSMSKVRVAVEMEFGKTVQLFSSI